MIFVEAKCFKELRFEHRVGSVSNFCRIKVKSVVIFPIIFGNGWFFKFFISNIKFFELFNWWTGGARFNPRSPLPIYLFGGFHFFFIWNSHTYKLRSLRMTSTEDTSPSALDSTCGQLAFFLEPFYLSYLFSMFGIFRETPCMYTQKTSHVCTPFFFCSFFFFFFTENRIIFYIFWILFWCISQFWVSSFLQNSVTTNIARIWKNASSKNWPHEM